LPIVEVSSTSERNLPSSAIETVVVGGDDEDDVADCDNTNKESAIFMESLEKPMFDRFKGDASRSEASFTSADCKNAESKKDLSGGSINR
jgi:hypothetical protein